MTSRRRFVLEAIFAVVLTAAAFGCGWLAYGFHHSQTRTIGYAVPAQFMTPRGFRFIGWRATPSTTRFSAGDRVDLLILIDGKPDPLVLDALVTRNTKTHFGLMVRAEDSVILSHVLQRGQEIISRPTIVPSKARYAADFLYAQEELKRMQADGPAKP